MGGYVGFHSGKFRAEESITVGKKNNQIIMDKNGIFLKGDARVREHIAVPPESIKAPASAAASFIKHGVNGAWSYADSKDQNTSFSIRVPDGIDFTEDVIFRMAWSSAATSGDVVWNITYTTVNVGDDTTGSGTTDTQTITTSSTANGLQILETTIPASNISKDNIYMSIEIQREGTNGSDTLSDSAELLGLDVQFVSNRVGGIYYVEE